MEYAVYHKIMHDAAAAFEAGDYDTAIAGFHGLLDADISDVDKAMICNNLAVISDRLGDKERALEWFDAGIAYEGPHYRFFIAECKAKFFVDNNCPNDALRLYEYLGKQRFLSEADKDRVLGNAAILRSQGATGEPPL